MQHGQEPYHEYVVDHLIKHIKKVLPILNFISTASIESGHQQSESKQRQRRYVLVNGDSAKESGAEL
jgi:hypothetical protein